MYRPVRFGLAFLIVFFQLSLAAVAQSGTPTTSNPATQPNKQSSNTSDPSQEPVIFERILNTYTYEADGTGTQENTVVAHIQSQAGVKDFAVLAFAYTSDNQAVEVDYVRVRKPDGSVVVTPEYNVQDMPAEVTRTAPMYSDVHQKHVTVKALGVGDVLEYKVRIRTFKPQVQGQFWFEYNFLKLFLVREEILEVSVPRDKYVKIESPDYPPAAKEDGQRKVYTWKSSTSSVEQREKLLKLTEAPKPSVQATTFKTWGEVGAWYESLQKPQLAQTPQLQAKAAELTKGLATDEDKIRAIYDFVATRFHYVSLSFGVGRYQPHTAEDVLENEYGDCKDKHTLLAALLKAAGYDAWPALINSMRKIDPAIPSPGQFNHVITVVPRGTSMIWLDTTPEVAPFGLLLSNLRDKQALVIPTDKAASLAEMGSLMTTPAQPPFPARQTFHVEGSLAADGTYTGRVTMSSRGDVEVLYRLAFRNTASQQWKELAQDVSYRQGFGGEVGNVTASVPDSTNKPFEIAYDYTKKNYGDWANHRIVAPVPWFGIEGTGTSDKKPEEPVQLGAIGDWEFTSKTKLPEGYSPPYKDTTDLSESFADYHAEYLIENGVLTANRRLVIKQSEVPLSSWETYKKFCKALTDERDRFVNLDNGKTEYPEGEGPEKPATASADTPKMSSTAVNPARKTMDESVAEARQANPEAGRLMAEAGQALQQRDMARAEDDLRRVIQMDPTYIGAHAGMAVIDLMRNNPDGAVAEMHKEVQNHPENTAAFQFLVPALIQMHHEDDAISLLRAWVKAQPNNMDAVLRLQALLSQKKDYAGAIAVLEPALKDSPDSPTLQLALAEAYLMDHQTDKGMPLLKKSIGDDPGALNNAAYVLADLNIDLELAKSYAQKSLARTSETSMKVQTDEEGFAATLQLSAVWDTVGWVYFREGKYSEALPYLRSSWLLSQDPFVGLHLGQVYEKLGKLPDAVHTYKLALASPGEGHDEIRKRLEKLTGSKVGDMDAPTLRRGPSGNIVSPGEELSRMRTVKVPAAGSATGSGVFTVVFSPGKLESVRMFSGDESMRGMTTKLESVDYKIQFPDSNPAKLVRRGMMVCSKLTGCDFVLLLPNSVHVVTGPMESD